MVISLLYFYVTGSMTVIQYIYLLYFRVLGIKDKAIVLHITKKVHISS